MVEGDLAAQTRRVFQNLEAILAPPARPSTTSSGRRSTCADMNDFPAMNEVYGTYFSAPAPARATVQAARCRATRGSKSISSRSL